MRGGPKKIEEKEEGCDLQLDNSPIEMTLCSGTTSFPTITHILTPTRQDDVATRTKVLVIRKHHSTAVQAMGQVQHIQCAVLRVHLLALTLPNRRRWDHTIDPESRNTTIRDHVELDVRVDLLSLALCDFEQVPLRRSAWRNRDDGFPTSIVFSESVASLRFLFRSESESVDRNLGCFVAVEVGSVYVEADESAACGRAKTEDDPIVGRVVTTSFPAIEEGSFGSELAFERRCGSDFEERGGGSEPLVRGAEDTTTEGDGGDLSRGGA